MKLSLFVPTLLSLTITAAPLPAQTPDAAPSATPDAAAAPAQAAPDPAAQVSRFFQTLIEGRVDAAYDTLLEGTKIVESPKDVQALKDKTKVAIHVFGSINGFEQVEEKKVGSRITRLTCISQGKNYPIRWRFYFYKPEEAWKLVDIRVDDRLTDLFDEPPRLIAAPAQPAAPAPAPQSSRKARQ